MKITEAIENPHKVQKPTGFLPSHEKSSSTLRHPLVCDPEQGDNQVAGVEPLEVRPLHSLTPSSR
jgi:hypothetical protein